MRTTLLRRTLAGGAVALAIVATTPLVARAQTTINFAANACSGSAGGNTGSGYNSYGAPFDVQGFRFTSTPSSNGFGTGCSGSPFYAGATGFFDNTLGSTTSLARISGAAFSISNIDLAFLRSSGSAQSVTFIGALAGGGTVSQIFAIPASGAYPASASAFTMFTFAPTFTNLASLSFMQTSTPYQFTNVRLDQAASAVVPEPGTWALLGTGLLGIGGVTLRRRSAPTA